MIFRIILLFIFISGCFSHADAQRLFGKDISVEALGYGADSIEALADAKRNATEKAYKTLISSNTQIENDEVINDAVVAHSYGLIKKWSTLETHRNDSLTTIKINATVYFSKFLGGKDKVKSNIKVKKLRK